MVRRHRLLGATYAGVLLAAFAGIVAVSSGMARPYLSPAAVPFGFAGLVAGFLALLGGGALARRHLAALLWRRAAARAGLQPAEPGGEESRPAFSGTRRGYPVRVRTVSDVGSNRGFTVTVVEALLPERQPSGLVVAPVDAGGIRAVAPGDSAVRRDGVAVAGDDPELAGRVADAVRPETVSAPTRGGQIYAGDTGALVAATAAPAVLEEHEEYVRRALPRDGSGEGVEAIRDELGAAGDALRDEIAGLGTDAATVVHYTAGPVLDGGELDRQLDAVVEVAAAVDR